jgi:hypothetical protein
MKTDLSELITKLIEVESQSIDSPVIIRTPSPFHAPFYQSLCEVYLRSSELDRSSLQAVVRDKPGIINSLLGYIYECARSLHVTGDRAWLQIGLAAAAMRGDGPDYRDFYLALAALYIESLDAGLNPGKAFNAIGGGVPTEFDTFAVMRSGLADHNNRRLKKHA